MKSTRFCRVAAAILALLMMPGALIACASKTSTEVENETESASEEIPDLTDDRVPTSTKTYADRLTSAFSANAPAPASDFTYTVNEVGVTVTAYVGGETVVVIPDTIEGKPVVAIGANAFAGKGTLSGLSIPDTVTSIEAGALADCRKLTTLRTPMAAASGRIHFGSLFGAESYETNASRVPAKLATLILTKGTTVEPYAFYDCDLEAVFLPDTVQAIGEFAFYGNEKLAHIPLGDTVLTAVGEHAFTNCRALLSLDLPASVDSLGFAMLEGCASLETLTVPFVGASREEEEEEEEEGDAEVETAENADVAISTDHLAYIFGAKAYVHSKGYMPISLIRVILLAGCGDIPANAFFECTTIREVVLPEGVTAIGHRAFYGCAWLSTVTLPDSVTTVGDDAFHGCIRLVQVNTGAKLETLGVQVFMDCVSLPSITLPASVKTIPNAAFAGCVSLETLTAPGVTEAGVGAQAFRHCDKLVGWEQ